MSRKRFTEEEARERHKEAQKKYVSKNRKKINEGLKRYRQTDKYKAYYENIGKPKEKLRKRVANAKSIEECDKEIYHKIWTDEEVEYLIDNYQDKTINQLSQEMGRTIMAIERKRNKLGLKKGAENV